ncbi:uncharacterized protein LOC119111724 [Pollicipes pollicipes]|uniref:uncharacterized protein LOC119111724 n=1 Tax=Pollicipes pollicipes TaxID=41117 RepID=UPI001884E968|nr:uncharacterized protein LOC119111724 [Pollicipes pollicipes]
MRPVLLIMLGCSLVSGGPAGEADFVSQPQDAHVQPGESVQLDCELVEADADDICAWRLAGTHLGVDHFYNVFPPPKVRALFPEHERVCTLIIEDVDWRHDGLWTCWPLDEQAHVSSRSARLTVAADHLRSADYNSTCDHYSSAIYNSTGDHHNDAIYNCNGDHYSSTIYAQRPRRRGQPQAPGPASAVHNRRAIRDPENARFFYYCKDGEAVHMQCEFHSAGATARRIAP